jgi:uncharacterized membrane protein
MTIVKTLSSEMGKVIEKRHEMILAWADENEQYSGIFSIVNL